MPNRAWLLLLLAALAGCARNGGETQTSGPATVTVAASAETEPTAEDGANGVAIWVHPEDGAKSLILGAAGTGGLEVYGLDGALRQRIADIEASHVAVRTDLEWNGGSVPLVLVTDPRHSALVAYTIDAASRLERFPGEPIRVEDEMTGVCTFRSPVSGNLYALVATDGGLLMQWQLFAAGGALKDSLVRTVPIGQGTEFCAVDDETATLYYADEFMGLMSLPAEPESDASRVAIDMAESRGRLAGEVKGVAFAPAVGGGRLVAVDESAERFAVYSADGALAGRFQIGAGEGVDAVGEGEGVALVKAPLGERFPEGLLVVADPENDDAHGNFKLVGWREIRTALGLPAEQGAESASAPAIRAVKPALETAVAETWGDAADDPAIWVHPDDPRKSVVIGTDKNVGLYVHDLDGRVLQTVRDGRMNNVDLRDGFVLGGRSRTLVAASNRTDKSITLYLLDPGSRRLSRIGEPVPTGFKDPYGLCMYAAPDGAGHYVIVNNADDGLVRQWRIRAEGAGIATERVREFPVGSQAEGCVADDEARKLYVAEEDGGFWVYGADPEAGSARREIDRVDGPNGLKGDIEGVAIWHGERGGGYVVVSNQGADNYAVYRREGDNEFVGLFQIVADPERGIDGVSETDGLEITSRPLGPRFPDGVLVVQDGRNIAPRERQNFKYVSWRAIAEALGLTD